ncbi:MAG: hypothetical protein KAJ19_25760, partial [Gammaproteobacteria bacterium]|nr:hypothetical protein [Gammaproteobacteria bacterium]
MNQHFKNLKKSITFVSTILILIALGSSAATAAIIDNGVIQIGVNDFGHLNVGGGTISYGSPGGGTTVVGLRYMALNTESTAQGTAAEGWGAADSSSGLTGYANVGMGTANIELVSFTNNSSEATSIVNIPNSTYPKLRVTHYYYPTPNTSSLYQVDVSILNVGSTNVSLKYRRIMDWDIEPTHFNEYVTINNGSVSELTNTTNKGLATSNVLVPVTGSSNAGSFNDSGPGDLGASFDFDFGTVEPGQTKVFSTFYGATANESEALIAIGLVNAEAYSLGQTSTGPANGTPNTFIFAFGGLGVPPSDSTPPSIIINTPINESTINDSTPELNATFDGETIAYTWYNVNNTANSTPVLNTNNLTLNLPFLTDGAH